MLQKIKILLFSVSAMLTLSLPALVPATAFAVDTPNIQSGVCQGSGLDITSTPGVNTDNSKCTTNTPDTKTFQGTLATIINIISIIVGVVAVIMIIFGGFKYITSGGEAEKVKGAKNTILYGLIGLIIVALAQLIVKFVLNQAAKTG